MKGNIAILVRGIHYFKEYKSPLKNIGLKNIDYRESYQSFLENILMPLEGNIDVYISSYNSEIENQMLNDFKPVKFVLNGFPGIIEDHTKRSIELTANIKKGLDLIPDTYDWYIIVRFDLLYKMKITEFGVKPNCVNFTTNVGQNNIDDNIHIFDSSHRNYFEQAIDSILNNGYATNLKFNKTSLNKIFLLHCMNFFLPYATNNKANINIFDKRVYTPHTSPYYKINI